MKTYQTVVSWRIASDDNRDMPDTIARIVENHLRETIAFAYDAEVTVDSVKTVDPSFHF